MEKPQVGGPCKLLRVGIEVEYTSLVGQLVYRSRPFWVSQDGRTALAIPDRVRTQGLRRSWRPFDHNSFEALSWLFNFWPVSEERMAAFVLPDAPPFFWHRLSGRPKTRVKLNGSHGSYVHQFGREGEPPRRIMLSHRYADLLPEPFRSQWYAARSRCIESHYDTTV